MYLLCLSSNARDGTCWEEAQDMQLQQVSKICCLGKHGNSTVPLSWLRLMCDQGRDWP